MKSCRVVRFVAVAMCLVVAILSVGCSSTGKLSSEYRETAAIRDRRVTLVAGDSIEMKFFYSPELNEVQTILPDGTLSLQLVGNVVAEGKTPERLQEELRTQYTKHIDKPEVAVMVRAQTNRVVYVSGAVNEPGRFPMPGHLTVLNAVMQAGGFKQGIANAGNVIVIRAEENKYRGYGVNLKPLLKGKDDVPFYLHAQDIVYVPRTAIVGLDDWVDQHIYKILPSLGLFVSPSN